MWSFLAFLFNVQVGEFDVKTSSKTVTLESVLILIAQMYVILTYLKLWLAVASHNFKWVKIHIL